MRILFLSIFSCLIGGFFCPLSAQDISQIGKTNPINWSGNLRLGSNYYQSDGDRDLLAPFNYSLGANLNLSAYNVSIPLSFYYTHGNSKFSRSFNLAGASPYYKWIKLHLGDRSMKFSPYVMSRRNFFGAGVELTPGNWNVSYLRGKLRNIYARRDTLSNATVLLPEFDRKIQGAKIWYNAPVFGMGIDLIKVKDDVSTLPDNFQDLTTIKPQENLVGAFNIKATLFKSLIFKANLASSILTQDLSYDFMPESSDLLRAISGVIEPNLTTRLSIARDASVNYRFKKLNLGFQYKQVDPFYRSLAAAYFQNDIINYTGNVDFSVLKNKLSIRTRVGLQKDNVKGNRAYTNRRIIGSIVSSYAASKQFFATVQYSNFQRENMSGLLEINDTLRYVSYSGNLMANARYKVETKAVDYTFQVSGFSQTIRDESPLFNLDQEITNYSANAVLRAQMSHLKLGISPGINYGVFEFPDYIQKRYGAQIGLNKSFYGGLIGTNFTTRYDYNDVDDFRDGFTWKNRFSANLRIKKKHRLTLTASYLDRNVVTQKSFTELRFMTSYIFKFL